MHNFLELKTKHISRLLRDQNTKIIDTRPVDAYNGWRFYNEHRGGHIKGAKSFPYSWLSFPQWRDIITSKALKPEQNIILYGDQADELKDFAGKLQSEGFNNVFLYRHFADEWTADPELPMEHLARFDKLVPPQWVKQLIDGESPEYYANDTYKIVHAHYRNRDAYLSGHIPGAIDMDTLALEAPETWNRRSSDELKQALEAHGITADTTVVLYGKFLKPDNNDPFPGSAAGHIGAIRLAMIMMYAGVKDVRVLNGGFKSWESAGYPVSNKDVPKIPVDNFGVEIPAHPEIIVDIDEAKQMLKAPDAELVSVRSWAEFIGEVSGYNYIEKKGRIPGAVFGNCGSDAYHMENYRNIDHTTREAQEIIANWQAAGITPDKHLAFYCGTGWRGSEAWFNAWLLGWSKVSVFDGGWFEWSNDPNNPYETGLPKD